MEYSQILIAQGGRPPYIWAVESGSLPPGLTLDSTTGIISGTTTTSGSFGFGLLLIDQGSQQARKTLSIDVAPADRNHHR